MNNAITNLSLDSIGYELTFLGGHEFTRPSPQPLGVRLIVNSISEIT
jgi:hypothetical protein